MKDTLIILKNDIKIVFKKYYTILIYFLYFSFEKMYRFLYMNIRKLYYHAEKKRMTYEHIIMKNDYDIGFKKKGD